MIDNKYYTPELEEFHIRFRYEQNMPYHPDFTGNSTYIDNWHRCSFPDPFTGYKIDGLKPSIEKQWIRVKYLDQDDIEELGWKLVKDYNKFEKNFQLFIDEYDWYELMTDENQEVIIEKWLSNDDNTSNGYTLFRGKIKNFNELQRIMKQLGI